MKLKIIISFLLLNYNLYNQITTPAVHDIYETTLNLFDSIVYLISNTTPFPE
jgi:hypothetical protein